MAEPVIAHKGPAVLTLGPGTYFWCSCGLSRQQPFCDSSHKGTGLKPLRLEITETQEVCLCQCKHSCHKPFCDDTHLGL
jgi:CDGSH-type Zn-finger protein